MRLVSVIPDNINVKTNQIIQTKSWGIVMKPSSRRRKTFFIPPINIQECETNVTGSQHNKNIKVYSEAPESLL